MAEATRAAYELPKHDITKHVAAPPVRVSALDLLGFLPALSLHSVCEVPRVEVTIVVDDEGAGVVP